MLSDRGGAARLQSGARRTSARNGLGYLLIATDPTQEPFQRHFKRRRAATEPL
jgi:hypothetical protein